MRTAAVRHSVPPEQRGRVLQLQVLQKRYKKVYTGFMNDEFVIPSGVRMQSTRSEGK